MPPDVALDTGDGPHPLHERFGRPLVLNFWASWCGPCIAELDQLTEARARYGDRLGIVTVSAEAPGIAARYLASRDIILPLVVDPQKRLFHAFGVQVVPVTLVLRADGTLAHVSVGELDPGELAAALAAVTAPGPISTATATAPEERHVAAP